MNPIRIFWYVSSLAFTTAWWSVVCVVAGLSGVKWKKGGIYDQCARKWGTWLCWLNGLTVRVEGLDQLSPDRPYVFIANHFSFCDIWALLVALPDSVRFLAKKELFAVPLFGQALLAARHIRIDRKNLQAAFGAYEEAAKVIRDGLSAIVYAEGTRSPDGKLQPFKKGPFVLAIASQVEVVPVWVEGAFEAQPKGQWYVRPGVVTVKFGVPIPTEGLDYEAREQLMEQVRERILGLAAATR